MAEWTQEKIRQTMEELFTNLPALSGDPAAILEEVRYQGFDPILVIRNFYTKEANKALAQKELMFLIRLAILRGTRWDKAVMRMSEAGRAHVNALAMKYKLSATAGTGSDPNTLTLSRLVSAFAPFVAMLLKDPLMRENSTYRNVRLDPITLTFGGETHQVDPSQLPEHLRFPGSNSLGMDPDMQLAYLAWSVRFHMLVNPRDSLQKAIETCQKWSVVTGNSQVLRTLGLTARRAEILAPR